MALRCSSLLKRSTSSLSLLVISLVILIFVLATIWESDNLFDDRGLTVIRETYHDEIMARAGQNYPVCSKIQSLEDQLKADQSSQRVDEERYEGLLHNGGLNCGNVRVGMGLFSKRFAVLLMR